MRRDYSRSISLQCSTCGGTDFEFEDEHSENRCIGCERVFSREDLIQENNARIENEVEDLKSQFIADVRKDFKKMFKNLK